MDRSQYTFDSSRDEYGHPIGLAAYADNPQFSTSMHSLYGNTDIMIDAKPQGASFRDQAGQDVREGKVGEKRKGETGTSGKGVSFEDSVAEK
ncbi:hypothetical protein HDV00_001014 [Rhizophlyctis rosea]|nr:hypothetical protein HDV00_001014 [Rhizophlyctis rosea]